MTSSSPSIADLRTVTQPDSTLGRASAEHWAGPLYMRRLSPYVTRTLLRTPITANGVTWLMIVLPNASRMCGCAGEQPGLRNEGNSSIFTSVLIT